MVGKKLATALCYGLNTDTDDLVRGVSPQDVAAYGYLKPKCDSQLLHSLELAEIPRAYAPYFTEALQTVQAGGLCPVICFAKLPSADVCVHIADFLSQFTNMKWVAVGGICDNVMHVVMRESLPGSGRGQDSEGQALEIRQRRRPQGQIQGRHPQGSGGGSAGQRSLQRGPHSVAEGHSDFQNEKES